MPGLSYAINHSESRELGECVVDVQDALLPIKDKHAIVDGIHHQWAQQGTTR